MGEGTRGKRVSVYFIRGENNTNKGAKGVNRNEKTDSHLNNNFAFKLLRRGKEVEEKKKQNKKEIIP